MAETKKYDFRKTPTVEEVDENFIYAYATKKGLETMKECCEIIERNTKICTNANGKEYKRRNKKKIAEEFIEKYYQKISKNTEKQKDILEALKEEIAKAEEKAKKKEENK